MEKIKIRRSDNRVFYQVQYPSGETQEVYEYVSGMWRTRGRTVPDLPTKEDGAMIGVNGKLLLLVLIVGLLIASYEN